MQKELEAESRNASISARRKIVCVAVYDALDTGHQKTKEIYDKLGGKEYVDYVNHRKTRAAGWSTFERSAKYYGDYVIPVYDREGNPAALVQVIESLQQLKKQGIRVDVVFLIDHSVRVKEAGPRHQQLGRRGIRSGDPLWKKLGRLMEEDGIIVLGGCKSALPEDRALLEEYAAHAGRRVRGTPISPHYGAEGQYDLLGRKWVQIDPQGRVTRHEKPFE